MFNLDCFLGIQMPIKKNQQKGKCFFHGKQVSFHKFRLVMLNKNQPQIKILEFMAAELQHFRSQLYGKLLPIHR